MSATISNSYLAGLLTGQPEFSAAFSSPAHAWLNRLRADAVDRVGALTVPTTRDEEWRFTDISPLTKIPFQPTRNAPSLDAGKIEHFTLPEPGARLVFVDGVYAPGLSFNNAGIGMENLAAGMAGHRAQIAPHPGGHPPFPRHVFTPLQPHLLAARAFIDAPVKTSVQAP